MGGDGVKRKLATFLAADVVGYSRLIAADDEDTVHRLHQNLDIIDTCIRRHDGRLFNTAGDSVMAEFPSAIEAARCAVEIQEEIALRNAELGVDQRMRYRIGINVGEAIAEGDDLHGDGVNVAARLQQIAAPDEILMSASAYDQVRGKYSAEIEPLGQRRLKNIPDPVSVFRLCVVRGAPARQTDARSLRPSRRRAVLAAAGTAVIVAAGAFAAWHLAVGPYFDLRAFKSAAAFPLPQEPSIVVLPFENSSPDQQQTYFSEGLSEDIMGNLTKLSGLFVVGRNSAFSYSGKKVQAKFVGRELGVRYVLQGSVRRADSRVRVSSFLVDAVSGRTVWSGRHDRRLDDIFAVQDEISSQVAKALAVGLRDGEMEQLHHRYAQNFAAYDAFLRARKLLGPPTRSGLLAARQLFQDATELDPEFAGGFAGISLTHSHAVRNGFSAFPPADIDAAEKYAKIALTKNDRSGIAQLAMANVELLRRNQVAAVEHAKAAQRLHPADANVNAVLGLMLTFAGRPREALEPIDHALKLERLEKEYKAPFYFFKMFAAYSAGDYAAAAEAYERYVGVPGAECRRNCLLYASATKWKLSEMTNAAPQEHLKREALELARDLRRSDPGYLDRFWIWTSLQKDGKKAREIDTVLRGLWDKVE